MKKYFILALAALLLVTLAIPLTAQDGPVGGIIIEGNAGGDPTALDPLLSGDATASGIQNFIFPDLFYVDPATAQFVNGPGPNALATGWEISEDGLTYTFTIREDLFWSDGEQITAEDVVFNYEAITSGDIESPRAFALDAVTNVELIDDFTFRVTFAEVNCDALSDAGSLLDPPYPSHIAPEDLATLPDQPFNQNPSVTAGVYTFGELRPAEAITLLADQNYVDAELGYVNNDGYVALNVPDLTVNVERFLAGELNVIDGPQEARRADIYAAEEAGDVTVYSYPGNSWDYLAFNLADPENPQSAVDENGNPIEVEQGIHPIFGNTEVGKDVRRALNLALDVDDIINRATFGEGTRMAAHLIPASWAMDPDLAPIPFDLEMAAQMLDEAGWVNSDPDDLTSIRVCQGCGTAEDGAEMRFELITNEENARRTAIITIAQENWSKIGVVAEIQTIEFFTMLDILDSQTFDAYVLGWLNGYPDRPDATQLFTPAGDVVGGCSNCGSYNNPEFNRVNAAARNLPGCDIEERQALYAEAQAIIQEDSPYIFLFARNGFYAVRNEVEGFDPFPAALFWNVDTWAVRSPE
jgi:peptide/nickel transport system substrate-binding protein